MKRALAGRAERAASRCPRASSFVDIDRDTGKLAAPGCPRVIREAFLAGTEPTETCELHRY